MASILAGVIASAIAATSASLSAGGAIVGAISTIVATTFVTGITFGINKLASGGKAKGSDLGNFSSSGNQKLNLQQDSVDTQKIIYGRIRVSGLLAFAGTTSTRFRDRGLHMVVVYADHEVEEIEQLWLDENPLTLDGDGKATDDKYLATGNDNWAAGTQLVTTTRYTGTTTQTVNQRLKESFPEWDDNHKGLGVAYVAYLLAHSPDVFPNGIPNPTAIIKGRKVYDPRTSTTAYSNNWALCVRDYLTNTEFGLGVGEDEIDDASVIASANICDEDVTLIDGSTQKRYTLDGIIDTAARPLEVLEDMATCAAGAIVYSQGKFFIHAGYYEAPAVDIDRSWLRDTVEVIPKAERDDLFNAVSGVYVEPDKNWQVTDFPILTNPTYEAEDRNQRITRDIEYKFITNGERAQRLAKIALERGRQAITVKLKCNLKALQLKPWDTVTYTEPLLGFESKVFRVLDWSMNSDSSVDLLLREEASGIYDWNAGEATTYDLAPNTNLPDPTVVDTVGNLQVTEELYSSTTGSGVKARAILTWDEADEGFLDRYEVSYKLTSASDYTPAGVTTGLTFTVFDIDPGVYDFRVYTRSYNNVLSEPVITTKELFGLTAPPADITNFRIQAIDGAAHLQWDQAVDLDVKIGGSIELRHTSKTTGYSWSDGIQIGPALSGISTNATVELLAGTYLVKAVDSTGNKSVNATAVTVANTNISGLTEVATATQQPSFDGAKTNMAVNTVDGTLRLDGVGLFDDEAGNFDDAAGFFDYGNGNGFETSGTYIFDDGSGNDYIDLGATYTGRIQVFFNGLVFDAAELFDDAGGNFDSRSGLFDGTEIDDIATTFEIRTTDDDPSSSPSWTDWMLFRVGDYTCRAFQIRVNVTSQQDSYNIAIDELYATVTLPSRTERFEDEATTLSGVTKTYTAPFFQKPNVRVMIQGAVSGDTEKITHITTGSKYTGVTIEVLNGGSNVNRTVDIFALGV